MKKRHRALRFFLVLFLIASVLTGCESGEEKKTSGGIRSTLPDEGDMAPPFELTTFDGRKISLEQLRGRPIVLNFWASWCVPCKAEAKDLQEAYTLFKELGVEFVGIAVQDTREDAMKFIEEYGVTYPNGLDETGDIARDYKIYGIPKTFVIDREGRFIFMHTGSITKEMLSNEIKKLI